MDDLQHNKNLFRLKFEELERCCLQMTNYSLIQASNPIRSLLLDSQPLVDVLNRVTHIPITYAVNAKNWPVESPGLIPVLQWKEVIPVYDDEILRLKKDAFLKFDCLCIQNQMITVHEVIRYYAYVRGGIHLDNGADEYKKLRDAFEFLKINKISTLDHTMRGITQVIYDTLKQHKEKLLHG